MEPHVHIRLLDAFAQGASVENACAYAGISPRTFYNWMARADDEITRVNDTLHDPHRDPDQPPPQHSETGLLFVQLLQDVSRVRAERSIKMLEVVDRVAHGGELISVTNGKDGSETRKYTTPDWRPAVWWLERAFPDQYSRKVEDGRLDKLEVTGKDGGPIQVADATAIAALTARLRESYALQAGNAVTDDGDVTDAEVVEEDDAR